jgi:tetratricopeptide (TPR) repeat protein
LNTSISNHSSQDEATCIAEIKALQDRQDFLGSLQVCEQKASLVKESATLLFLQGISFYKLQQLEPAKASYEKALKLKPDFVEALNNLGFLLQDLDDTKAARHMFQKAIDINPSLDHVRLNLALTELKLGDWERGWEHYESRWSGSAEATAGIIKKPSYPIPQWHGEENTAQQNILVVTEQGFGDTFQFVRYLKKLTTRFAKVGFACSDVTMRLMEWSFSEDVVLFKKMPNDFSGWDVYVSLLSLPKAFKTRTDSIPDGVPYLRVPTVAKKHWAKRLEISAPKRFKIGIAWAGRESHQYNWQRNIPFEQLKPLLDDEKITWVSLQKWSSPQATPEIPETVDWIDWTDELTDFADTAALMSELDMVISIDSSMVHLAGALGKEVWMLNRFSSEWRWFTKQTSSPWYPTLKIFNQTSMGDWQGVIQLTTKELQALKIESAPRIKKNIAKTLPPQNKKQNTSIDPSQVMSMSAEQALQIANQHLNQGNFKEAAAILKKILAVEPQNAFALHLLGVVLYQSGQAKEGMHVIKQAINIDPHQALFHSNLAEMCRQHKQLREAKFHGLEAIKLQPNFVPALSNLGVALFDLKEFDESEAVHLKALSIDSHCLQSINNLGSIERTRNHPDKAMAWYRKAIKINPSFLDALNNLSAVLIEEERPDEAVPFLEDLLKKAPNYVEAISNYGLAFLLQDKMDEAHQLLHRSLTLRPGHKESLVGLARILREKNLLNEAESLLHEVLKKDSQDKNALVILASVYIELSKMDEAQEIFGDILKNDPAHVGALLGLANLKIEMGDLKTAESFIHEALKIKEDHMQARFLLAQVKKVKPEDENIVKLNGFLEGPKALHSHQRIPLYYALGKSYDDIKDFDKAFDFYARGAALKREKIQYSVEEETSQIDAIIEIVNQDFIEKFSREEMNASTLPIFVLGMPRSGTTLTEQIIASHPKVFGAGELPYFMEAMQEKATEKNGGYPYMLKDLTEKDMKAMGNEYIRKLRLKDKDKKFITDKMPANYLNLGLIHLILPHAKIIHVKRNPVDTCISCFTRLFYRHQDATYDLTEVGRHYANYARLMDHWRRVLPKESFFEVHYEAIVEDVEKEARKLIEYCGLPWDPSCLNFYALKRNVKTASVTQVRQPIYDSSVERWRHYEKNIGPLLKELDGLY